MIYSLLEENFTLPLQLQLYFLIQFASSLSYLNLILIYILYIYNIYKYNIITNRKQKRVKWRVWYDNCNNCNWNAVFVNHWHSSVCIYFITFQLLQLSFIYQAKAISSTGNIFCKTLWHNDIWCFYDKLTKCKLLICMKQKKQVFCFFSTSGNRAEILFPRRYSRRVWRRVFSFGFPSGFLRDGTHSQSLS